MLTTGGKGRIADGNEIMEMEITHTQCVNTWSLMHSNQKTPPQNSERKVTALNHWLSSNYF